MKKIKNPGRLSVVLCIVMLFSSVAFVKPAKAENAAWTVMVYMTGSDLESDGAAATRDMTEMLRSGMDPEQVQVIVATGGTENWFSHIPSDSINYYLLREGEPEELVSKDLTSMGDSKTLSDFINYGHENYPADQYALILWDHGGGPLMGVCFDELFTDKNIRDSLSLEELGNALADSPFSKEQPLAFIGFDACLMGSLETAAVVEPYAKYMIVSEETEPQNGWNYQFLKGLEKDKDGHKAGIRIIDQYFAGQEDTKEKMTLSCVDLSGTGQITAAMDELFASLDTELSEETFSAFSNSRKDAQGFGRSTTGSEYDMVDLSHLSAQFQEYAEKEAEGLTRAIADAVVYEKNNLEQAAGLSIYFPYYNKDAYQESWQNRISLLEPVKSYVSFLENYTKLWFGTPSADFNGIKLDTQPLTDQTQTIELALTPQQIEDFAYAQLLILMRYDYYNYTEVGEVIPMQLDEEGTLSGTYDFQGLYVYDEEGQPASDPLEYHKIDDRYLVAVQLKKQKDDGKGEDGWLCCALDEETEELEVVSFIKDNPYEEELHHGKAMMEISPEEWPYIVVDTEYYSPFKWMSDTPLPKEEEIFIPFSQWTDTEKFRFDWKMSVFYHRGNPCVIDNSASWTLKFDNLRYTAEDLYAQVILYDTYGNVYGSNLTELEHPYKRSNFVDYSLYEDNRCSVKVTEVGMIESVLKPGLYVKYHLDATNDSEGPSDYILIPSAFQTQGMSLLPMDNRPNEYVAPGVSTGNIKEFIDRWYPSEPWTGFQEFHEVSLAYELDQITFDSVTYKRQNLVGPGPVQAVIPVNLTYSPDEPVPAFAQDPAQQEDAEEILNILDNANYENTLSRLRGGEVITQGTVSDTARGLQQTLNAFGCGIAEDGSAGPGTFQALNEVLNRFGRGPADAVDADLYTELLRLLVSKQE